MERHAGGVKRSSDDQPAGSWRRSAARVCKPVNRRAHDADHRLLGAAVTAGASYEAPPSHQQYDLPCRQGEGATTVGDKKGAGDDLTWGAKDCFFVPSWKWHHFKNMSKKEPAIIFSVTDRPILESLVLFREQRDSHRG